MVRSAPEVSQERLGLPFIPMLSSKIVDSTNVSRTS